MNATQALTRLRKLLGKNAAIQDAQRPSSPELRAQANAARQAASAAKREAEQAMNARRDALLAADVEYQSLAAAYKASVAAEQAAPWAGYRYTAGTSGALFFSVVAEADTLADLIEKAESEKTVRA